MTIEVPHNLGTEEAKLRIEGLLGDVKREFGDRITDLEETWTGNQAEFSFRAMGFGVSGRLAIEPSVVRLSGKLPMAAIPFRGRIEQVIRERATALLSGWQAGTVESADADE